MNVVVAVDGARGREAEALLDEEGVHVVAVVDAAAPAGAIADAAATPEAAELVASLSRADALLLDARSTTLTPALVSACDRFGVRIVPLCARPAERRLAASLGLVPRERDIVPGLLSSPVPEEAAEPRSGRVITVWGPHGAPGRTTVAVELACTLGRSGHTVLVDADAHASSVALATGLADEGPGFAAACRQAERGSLTVAELARIASPLGGVDVLTGINRPGRWPELSAPRVHAALEVCRAWAQHTVVDVAAPLERDEEIVSDLVDGPRRNAATLAALETADVVVAVVAADPVGVSRFVRAWPDLRALAGAAPVRVLVNKTRAGAVGLDARGQIRRTLERYAGVGDVWFAPWDVRGTDAALLAARPLAHIAPRAALAGAVRRFAEEALGDRSEAVVVSRARARGGVRRRLARPA